MRIARNVRQELSSRCWVKLSLKNTNSNVFFKVAQISPDDGALGFSLYGSAEGHLEVHWCLSPPSGPVKVQRCGGIEACVCICWASCNA